MRAGLLAVLTCLCTHSALAQEPPSEPPSEDTPTGEDNVDQMSPQERFEEALRLSELGGLYFEGDEFEQAAEMFTRAWELHRDQNLGYNAARSYENAGNYERALAFYRATLELDMDDPGIRQRCEDGVTRSENILQAIEEERARQPASISVRSDPEGADILLDGEPSGVSPAEISVPAGTYLLRLELEGHDTHEEEISVEPGQDYVVRVTLNERPAVVSPPPAEPSGGPNWLAVGLTTAGAGVFATIGALSAQRAHDKFDEAQSPAVQRNNAAFENVVDEGRNAQATSNLFYGLSIATLFAAVIIYFVTDDSPDEDAADTSGARLDFAGGSVGLSVLW